MKRSALCLVFVVTSIACLLTVSSCSREEEDSNFFRPLIQLPSDRVDARQPELFTDAVKEVFTPLTITESEEGHRLLFHGEIHPRPFPVEEVRRLDSSEQAGQIGGGFRFETSVIQISEWQRPPYKVLSTMEEADYRQEYSRHLFLNPAGKELTPEAAVARFPQAGGSALFPVNRNGSWYQHSFKRQVALWFRIRNAEGIPMKGEKIKFLGAIDQQTGFPIPGGGLYGMGNADYRAIISTPFWHDGGLDFIFDQYHTLESSEEDFDLAEGEIYGMGGFQVQVLLFRSGVWESRPPNEQETEMVGTPSFIRAVEKVSDKGSTFMAVTDGGPIGRDWMMEVVGVDGKTIWPVRRNDSFLFQVFGNTSRSRDRVEPSQLRITRGPSRDRVVVSMNSIPQTQRENQSPDDLFDQRVPFFYAKNLTEAMKALSELVAIEHQYFDSSVPRKPEGFPLALQDATALEIAAQIRIILKSEGWDLRLNRTNWQWDFQERFSPAESEAQLDNAEP